MWFVRNIDGNIKDMGMDSYALRYTGTAKFGHKQPDTAFIPRVMPAGRDKSWPSVVLEVGWSEGNRGLMRPGQSNHHVANHERRNNNQEMHSRWRPHENCARSEHSQKSKGSDVC